MPSRSDNELVLLDQVMQQMQAGAGELGSLPTRRQRPELILS